jgi:hypothetical protein
MRLSDKEELAKFRAQRKRSNDYKNQYNKENYKRMTCMYPIERADAIAEAMKQAETPSVSEYIAMLVTNDLHKRGLIG